MFEVNSEYLNKITESKLHNLCFVMGEFDQDQFSKIMNQVLFDLAFEEALSHGDPRLVFNARKAGDGSLKWLVDGNASGEKFHRLFK